MSATRRARVRALAKINLDLRVLGLRPDGYHELRTIFQTVSLADTIDLAFTPGRGTRIDLADPLAIPDNLALRAARLVLEVGPGFRSARDPAGQANSHGSGFGRRIERRRGGVAGVAGSGRLPSRPWRRCSRLAEQLGSDVPFFLLGGRAAGIGRGTELFPLPDGRPMAGRAGGSGTPRFHRRRLPRLEPQFDK